MRLIICLGVNFVGSKYLAGTSILTQVTTVCAKITVVLLYAKREEYYHDSNEFTPEHQGNILTTV